MKKLFAMVLCLAMCLGVLALTASAAGEAYYVAGSEALCNGKNWDPGAEVNKMTDNGDGTHSITYTNVPAGSYEFKVTIGNWDQSWGANGGSDNYKLQLDAACDVTIIFKPETKEITVNASGAGEVKAPAIEYMEIVGEGIDGITWTPGQSIRMTMVSEGVYEYTFDSVSAGAKPNIKFAANGNWNDYNIGCIDGSVGAVSGAATDAGWNSSNIWFDVAADSKVTIRLDLTGLDYATGAGAKYTITVAALSGGNEDSGEVETPVAPNPGTGDAISVIVALLAVSAAGIAVIAKKKF